MQPENRLRNVLLHHNYLNRLSAAVAKGLQLMVQEPVLAQEAADEALHVICQLCSETYSCLTSTKEGAAGIAAVAGEWCLHDGLLQRDGIRSKHYGAAHLLRTGVQTG